MVEEERGLGHHLTRRRRHGGGAARHAVREMADRLEAAGVKVTLRPLPRGQQDVRADESVLGGCGYPAAPSEREMTISACAFSSGRTECPR